MEYHKGKGDLVRILCNYLLPQFLKNPKNFKKFQKFLEILLFVIGTKLKIDSPKGKGGKILKIR